MTDKAQVSTESGIELCKLLHVALCGRGFFPALTGGLLYKDGNRKGIDIVIYRHRQKIEKFEMDEIEPALVESGLSEFQYFGFVTKCKWRGFSVDLFNPETKAMTEEEYDAMCEQAANAN